jgi:hypothetical protein
MNTNDTINRKFKSKITYIGLAVALAIPCGAAIAGNPSGERRAQVLEFTFPIDAGLISCPEDNQLDGQEVSGYATVKGIAKNSDFLTPWLDGSGGKHLQQIARITYDVEAGNGAYHWLGRGRGKFMEQGGGGNGDHQGGVAMYFQEEYYSAQGDYPDLYWKLDFALVVDAKGNPRVYREEVSEADFVCVSD